MFPSSVLTRPRSALLCGSGLLAALAGTPAAAQEPLSTASTAAAVAPLRAPLRAVPTTSGDAPAESGVWAAGPDYKVSFHDGRVEFHPVLGPDAPRNLPVTWTTTAVFSGDAPVVEPGAVAHESFSDWRFERRTGTVTEAWNVRADGVEQTFVFAAPLGNGDLVVRGRLDSELEAALLAPARHAALEFRDGSGRTVVRYGEAYAIDATGRLLPLATAFDGSQVELRVPAAWLATAEWPVTIDPLLSAATIAAGTSAVTTTRVAIDEESREALIAYTRAVSSSDWDAYVHVSDASNATLGVGTLVLADQTVAVSTRAVVAAYAGGADAWTIALERQPRGPGLTAVRYQVRARRDHARNDVTTAITLPVGTSARELDLGGSSSFAGGQHALLVMQTDASSSNGNTDTSDVMAVVVDARTRTHTPPFIVSPDGSSVARRVDRDRPSVQPESVGATEGWLVLWQELSNATAGDDWDLYGVRVLPNGNRSARGWFGVAQSSVHSVTPRVAGRDGEYLVTFGEVPNLGTGYTPADTPILRVQRFQWKPSQTAPVQGEVRTLVAGSGAYRALGTAFDTRTGWHWCVAWSNGNGELYLSRLGYDGMVAEGAHLTSGTPRGAWAGVAYDLNRRDFVAAYGTDEAGLPVKARRFAYPSTAQVTLFGQGCGTGTPLIIDVPHAGHGSFRFGMDGLPGQTAALLLLGAASADVPLDGLGMTGCRLLVDAGRPLVVLPLAVSSLGSARPTLTLPSTLHADLVAQVAWFAPGANPAGIAAGRGFRVQVR